MVPLDITRPEASQGGGSPAVLLVAGEGQVTTYAFSGDHILIGRAPECEVVLPHASLSRRHAEVRLGPPISVRDLGSTNGTQVAGQIRLGGAAHALRLGESFHIGPFSFMVLAEAGAQRSHGTQREVIRVDDPVAGQVPSVVRTIAASSASVLILGETGVGKDVLARSLHDLSQRKGAYLRINCAALAESLLESELFGHEQGAFTGATKQKRGLLEAADGGTAFLDEIGELAPALQAKLLRVLEAGEVTRVGAVTPIPIDVRFVAATHRDVVADVAAGRFRADLYYRLDGVSLLIPPLRERRAMIAPLARGFVVAAAGSDAQLTPGFLARLETHDWPGNVRELKATVERAVLIAEGGALSASHVMLSRRIPRQGEAPAPARAPSTPPDVAAPPPDLSREQTQERERILAALDACAGNQTRAAKQLGISRATLTGRLALYRIPRPRR